MTFKKEKAFSSVINALPSREKINYVSLGQTMYP